MYLAIENLKKTFISEFPYAMVTAGCIGATLAIDNIRSIQAQGSFGDKVRVGVLMSSIIYASLSKIEDEDRWILVCLGMMTLLLTILEIYMRIHIYMKENSNDLNSNKIKNCLVNACAVMTSALVGPIAVKILKTYPPSLFGLLSKSVHLKV